MVKKNTIKITELVLCLAANIMSIIGYGVWIKQTELNTDVVISHNSLCFTLLYFVSLIALLIRWKKPHWSLRSPYIQFLIKYLITIFYSFTMAALSISLSAFILPEVDELTAILGVEEKITLIIGFAIDMYAVISFIIELALRKNVLHFWSIGMSVFYTGILVMFIAYNQATAYAILDITAAIIWYIFLSIYIVDSRKNVDAIYNKHIVYDLNTRVYILTSLTNSDLVAVYQAINKRLPESEKILLSNFYDWRSIKLGDKMNISDAGKGVYNHTLYEELHKRINEYDIRTPLFLIADTNEKDKLFRQYPCSLTFLLIPDSFENVAATKNSDGTKTQKEVKKQIKELTNEIKRFEEFAYIISDDDVEKAADEILKIIAEYNPLIEI